MRLLIFAVGVLASVGAQAATLRSMTMLQGPTVALKDLFNDAGRYADRVLGPGPAPGGRIVVEAAQLNAIAREYDVSWRSVSRADRAVLEWPARPMPKQDVIDALKAAMVAAGASDDIDIDIPGFSPPLIPSKATPVASISELDRDANTGRFTAVLTVTVDGIEPIDTRISGRADSMVDAPVAVTRLQPDTVIRPEDIHIVRVRAALLQNDIARSVDEIVGMQLRRPVAAGQPLRLADLTRPPLVRRGSRVRIELSASGLSISGQAVALDSGADGERIRVQNIASRAYLFAEVIGPDQVRVTPDAPSASSAALPKYVQEVNGP